MTHYGELVRLDGEIPGNTTEFARTISSHYRTLLSKNLSYRFPIISLFSDPEVLDLLSGATNIRR